MYKILKYSIYDLLRSRWSLVYFSFYLILCFVLLFLNNDVPNAVITIHNVIVVLTPLIGTIFGVMYYYNSKEFVELLIGQPLKRSSIFLGQYLGISVSLSLSLVLGLSIPFAAYGLFSSSEMVNFGLLLMVGVFLTFIFVAIAYNIALRFDNKIKGFSYAIIVWLLMAVVYDGVLLILLQLYNDYPLAKFALGATLFNPIDLSRILVILNLDKSAIMGYTGEVFKTFLGTGKGQIVALIALLSWVIFPCFLLLKKAGKKDF
ncbi:MAG: ABC transporter permease [Flavobacteriales bacterium]|nr:ABC transporter permease [Flavobacteriales bacterium]